MHQIMLQQLQQTLGQDLVLRSKGVFQLNDLQPAAVAAIVGGDHRPSSRRCAVHSRPAW